MINTTGLALSTAAIAKSSKAHDIACHSMMQGYTHTTATVQQSREYSECVNRLHPDTIMTPVTMIIIKVLLLVVFAVMGIKLYIDRHKYYGRYASGNLLESAIDGFFIGIAVVLMLGLLGAALAFLSL